jgi:hypothetical protein
MVAAAASLVTGISRISSWPRKALTRLSMSAPGITKATLIPPRARKEAVVELWLAEFILEAF